MFPLKYQLLWASWEEQEIPWAQLSVWGKSRCSNTQTVFDIRQRRWQTSCVPASLTHISVCPGLKVRPPKCNPAKGAVWGFIPWPPLRQEQHSSQCGPWICLDLWSIHYFNSTHWLRVKNLFPVFFLFKERARMSQSHASSNWVSVSFVLETEK